MARLEARLPQNVPGEFYVDSTCIDCDTCRQIAPGVFIRADEIEMSVVARQPESNGSQRQALKALVACPTASIGTVSKISAREAAAEFPELLTEEIYYCGYTSEKSFGASSYLLRRAAGNVLVDSPRAAGPLLTRFAEMGGVRQMFLSHQDDVADHARFRRRFGCERIMHRLEGIAVERVLEGRGPVDLAPDLLAIPVPGHTRGSTALLYREKFLFTGDHLWWSETRGRLHASRSVCWYSWPEQTRSMERLLDYRFEWVLPGHGRRYQAASAAAMRAELEELVSAMRREL
jgi:glyoxylase-like metal-dependent hydrolase (beta-lactamase superfamily II)/ferredoxin